MKGAMQAIILAAGRGNRLRDKNPDGRPKCLLEFGGRSLLSRQMAILADCGVHRVELVVGFEADRIIEHVGCLSRRPEMSFSWNNRFLEGSVISLATARDTLCAGTDTLILDADVLFHPRIMERLVRTNHANCFLLDRDFEAGHEPVKIAVGENRILDFGKQLEPGLEFDMLGESVGFFRFDSETCADLARRCADYDRTGRGDAPHEDVLRDLVRERPGLCQVEDITGLPWLEIDFPEDVERAAREVMPAIEADSP
jgi:choline kinase